MCVSVRVCACVCVRVCVCACVCIPIFSFVNIFKKREMREIDKKVALTSFVPPCGMLFSKILKNFLA